ncbi:hypothetical protein [Rubidibacter lacunae]|uniref:hypothetical protein n=1 Tax=Rubidibacter lacunae TaxID=582514 RepID=UPI0004061C5C|nr:hypothetical protein [Rubidibacter lacunae]
MGKPGARAIALRLGRTPSDRVTPIAHSSEEVAVGPSRAGRSSPPPLITRE